MVFAHSMKDPRRCYLLIIVGVITLGHYPHYVSGLGVVPRVLYESDRILAIDKPPGISHHNSDATGELGIVSQLRDYYNVRDGSGPEPPVRLYGVHRLDRVTSGILLFAKDAEMAGILSKAFRDRTAVKYYLGISNRKPKKKKQGWVKGTMVRGRRKSWYLTSNKKDSTKGKESADNELVIDDNYSVTRFFTAGLGDLGELCLHNTTSDDAVARTCILFRPHTGKTHQLRVAAKSVGLPLLGDPIYGSDATTPAGSGPRTFLHAAAIHIPMGKKGVGVGVANGDGISDVVDHESVTIWCSPNFASLLWKDDAHAAFDQIMNKLFKSHCECHEILKKFS